jgi:hypothetical protein
MTIIHVPRPKQSAMDPNRPVNSLLKAQIEYLHDADRRLPLRYRTEIYANAIRTEGEAAEYVRSVTEAIHMAHAEAAAQRTRSGVKRRRVIEIAAVADDSPIRRRKNVAKRNSKTAKGSRKV